MCECLLTETLTKIRSSLWPNGDSEETTPLNCNLRDTLQYNSFNTNIKVGLSKLWHPLYRNNIWDHEWTRHGTCWNPNLANLKKVEKFLNPATKQAQTDYTSKKSALAIQQDYFNTALLLGDKFNSLVGPALSKLKPGKNGLYKKTDVANAIKAQYGVQKFSMSCIEPTTERFFWRRSDCVST